MEMPLSKAEKKERRKAEKAEKKRKKKKAKKNGCLFKIVWLIMIMLVSVVLAQYILVGVNDMLAINRPESTVTVDIPSNSSLDDVAQILTEKHVIDRPDFFKMYAMLTPVSYTHLTVRMGRDPSKMGARDF